MDKIVKFFGKQKLANTKALLHIMKRNYEKEEEIDAKHFKIDYDCEESEILNSNTAESKVGIKR